jgi:DNA-binding Lrp family transcriptional regulator
MAAGTNTELLGKGSKFTEVAKKAGRPEVNREIVIRNLKLKDQMGNRRYTNAQIARMVNCSPKTVSRIWKQALKDGDITEEEFSAKPIGVVEADFDSECERARGMSFKTWLSTRFQEESHANTNFNFCSKVWNQIFESCSLTDFRDQDQDLADQMAVRFVSTFQDDQKRMRGRLKKIRFLFRFLGRTDVCDRHLTMSNSKHPRPKRVIPEISQTDFPLLYQKCEDEMARVLGESARLDLRLKIVTQMRTGNWDKEREFYGIRKGSDAKSYLIMSSWKEYQFHVFAKKGEHWDIIWMPKQVAQGVFERYQEMEVGEQFASIPKRKFVKTWKRITKKIIGRELILHDLRKISITWLYCMGIPLDVCVYMNVGWKDMSTATSNYLDVKKVLRKSIRKEYQENIPEWFKEGLDEFTGFEAMINNDRAYTGMSHDRF